MLLCGSSGSWFSCSFVVMACSALQNIWEQHWSEVDPNAVQFEIRECMIVHHSFTLAHSWGVFEEDCTFDFRSLPALLHKVEYLFDHYMSIPQGYEYQGPQLPFLEVHMVVGRTPLPVMVKSLRFKHSEGSHGKVLSNQHRNPLMEETMTTTQIYIDEYVYHIPHLSTQR